MLKKLCVLLLSCTTMAQAVITRVDILQHKERNQCVYLYSDAHCPTQESVKQRDIFVQQAQKLQESSTESGLCVYVEDLLTKNELYPQLEQFIALCRTAQARDLGTIRKQFLATLVEELCGHGITTINAEFRGLMEASLTEGISSMGLRVSANTALASVEVIARKLQQSTLPTPFAKIMLKELTIFEQSTALITRFIDTLRSETQTLRETINSAPYDPAIDEALKLLGGNPESWPVQQKKEELMGFYFSLRLLELCVLRGIAEKPHVKHNMVCAGELHINRLRSLLEQAGFTIIQTHYGSEELKDVIWPEKAVNLQAVFPDLI